MYDGLNYSGKWISESVDISVGTRNKTAAMVKQRTINSRIVMGSYMTVTTVEDE
jgi:hypothetical protein